MRSSAKTLAKTAVQSSRWFLAFGMGTILLLGYLYQEFSSWLFADNTATSTTLTYVVLFVLMLAVSGVHFVSAYLLRYKFLLSVEVASPSLLSGPHTAAKVPLTGRVVKVPSNARLVGATGKAYIARINRSWYFLAGEAAACVESYGQPET